MHGSANVFRLSRIGFAFGSAHSRKAATDTDRVDMVNVVVFDRDEEFGGLVEEVAVRVPDIFVLRVHGLVRDRDVRVI